MPREQEYLFSNVDIFAVLEEQKARLKQRVQAIPGNTLLNASEDDLVLALLEEFRLEVPVIREDESHIAETGEARTIALFGIDNFRKVVGISRKRTRLVARKIRNLSVSRGDLLRCSGT